MKRFKDLNSTEKKKVVDILYRRNINDINWNGAGQPKSVKDRLKEITERIKFCGCGDCEMKLAVEINKDSVIKEVQLDKAMKQADEAFFPEDTDIIVKV
jgi:hypothetical protein